MEAIKKPLSLPNKQPTMKRTLTIILLLTGFFLSSYLLGQSTRSQLQNEDISDVVLFFIGAMLLLFAGLIVSMIAFIYEEFTNSY